MSSVIQIQLYGGSAHGKTMPMDLSESHRVEVATGFPRKVMNFDQNAPLPTSPNFTRHSYYLDIYRESRHSPQRLREIYVGRWEQGKLTYSEECELEGRLKQEPWKFRRFSILDEFDDWFAAEWYKRTGVLTWKGHVIH